MAKADIELPSRASKKNARPITRKGIEMAESAQSDRIRMAIQKSGRLSEKSMSLLTRSGLDFEWTKDRLLCRCENFPLDLMLLRDDDIPEYVTDGVCDLGIVGFNVLEEKLLARGNGARDGVELLRKLGFGNCRLSLAIANDRPYSGLSFFQGMRIATSYPASLRRFLSEKGIEATPVEIGGSVELAPTLKIAEAICDLVSTGTTLRTNGLREVETLLESESVLVRTRKPGSEAKSKEIARLLQRIEGVLKASRTKYIMMNAPRAALQEIQRLLPGMERPSIMPLGEGGEYIAIHAVSHENIFWETMEQLKGAGASSILVLPIEKIIQ
jgi:ATP phosphoribosyltransferase